MKTLRWLWTSGRARSLLGAVAGAGVGAAYAHYVGCFTGGCPLTSNPVTAALFGAAMGAMLLSPASKPPPPSPPAAKP